MAQSQERRVKMKKISRTTSGRSFLLALFLLFTRFANHWMTNAGLGMEAFGASWRFSAWLRWSRRGPQLHQKSEHSSSNLSQRKPRPARLPGTVVSFDQGACQNQLVVG